MTAPRPRAPSALSRAMQKWFTRLHVFVYRLTGGRLLGRFPGGAPMVLLTTRGRKTGQPRVQPLLALVEGGRVILIASNGGTQDHPQWYKNLSASPDVTVQVGARVREFRARTAEGDERALFWEKMVRQYGGYTGYQARTDRTIPVVVLEPKESLPPPR